MDGNPERARMGTEGQMPYGAVHTVYFRPKKMSKSEEGSSLGAIFRSKWELLSKAHKVILAARIPIETDILIL